MATTAATTAAISVRGLSKNYGQTRAVDDVSFEVARGSVFAFVGTNGAGKSTTIACLTTLLPIDAGEVTVLGHDARSDGDAVRAGIGVVFQDSILDPLLTVRENLRLRAAFYATTKAATAKAGTTKDSTAPQPATTPQAVAARIAELSELIGLGDVLGRRYGKISGGQRRRVDIARALLASPEIIFLDEPTAGLDPAGRAQVWSTIRQLRERQGLTVFLTTHYMEETEEADWVCLIDHGRVVAQGTPAQLRAEHSHSVLSVTSRNRAALSALPEAAGVTIDGESRALIPVDDAATALRILKQLGTDVTDFEFRHGTMDDVFLALTGGDQAEDAA